MRLRYGTGVTVHQVSYMIDRFTARARPPTDSTRKNKRGWPRTFITVNALEKFIVLSISIAPENSHYSQLLHQPKERSQNGSGQAILVRYQKLAE